MHAVTVLQKCLSGVFQSMHASRRRVLLGAVAALLMSRRLILMELARAWPGAERVRAPLKRLDRLLGNPHLAHETEHFYAAMAHWLIRQPRPVIVIDWSDLKPDGSLHLLRAGIPVGGRTLTLLEAIHPEREKNSPRVERQFLRRLQALLPAHVTPIIATDAGFRAPWFRAVRRLGWDYVGRVRHRTRLQLIPDGPWIANRALHAKARVQPQRFAGAHIVRNAPWPCDLVLVRRRARGRKHFNYRGRPVCARAQSRKAAARSREPWLLATSLSDFSPRQIVALYAKRMQIEESFRDLKCDRFGCALGYSLTRSAPRLAILLLLQALASFLAWLTALATPALGSAIHYGGIVSARPHRHYSLLRLGWEILRQTSIHHRDLWYIFNHPPQWWLRELEISE